MWAPKLACTVWLSAESSSSDAPAWRTPFQEERLERSVEERTRAARRSDQFDRFRRLVPQRDQGSPDDEPRPIEARGAVDDHTLFAVHHRRDPDAQHVDGVR